MYAAFLADKMVAVDLELCVIAQTDLSAHTWVLALSFVEIKRCEAVATPDHLLHHAGARVQAQGKVSL